MSFTTLEQAVLRYPNKDWDWDKLSENPNISMEFILKLSNKPWNWNYVSKNPNLTMDVIDNLDISMFNIDWVYIAQKPLSMEFIERYMDKFSNSRCMYSISLNPNITTDFIYKHIDKPWNWYGVSQNSGITMKDVENAPDLPWYWSTL